MDGSPYYTTKEAMALFGVSRLTLYRWIDAGKLDAVKTPGGHWRIPKDKAEALLSAGATVNDR